MVTPIFRMFDVSLTKRFYLDFLGFQMDWEHRFDEGMPLYCQISRDKIILHLSQHHGDCTPGSAVRIEMKSLDAFHGRLLDKDYPFARPGIEEAPWGTKEVTVTDPSGNRLVFYENL